MNWLKRSLGGASSMISTKLHWVTICNQWCLTIILLSIFSSLVTFAVDKECEANPQPAEKVARIVGMKIGDSKVLTGLNKTIRITHVDGKRTYSLLSMSGAPVEVNVQPGKHEIQVQYDHMGRSGYGKIAFFAEEGKTYSIRINLPGLLTISSESLYRFRIEEIDGVQASFRVSSDNKHVAYVAKTGDKMSVLVDGKEEKQYDDIGNGSFIFSPDSKRIVYVAKTGKLGFDKWVVVVDGKEEKQYDGIKNGSLLFSPDSKRIAYVAITGKLVGFVVVDGKEEKQYDGIGTIFFSPDSKRMAYQAKADKLAFGKVFVVIDGKEEKQYDGIGDNSFIFSPDSKHVAFSAKTGDKWFVIVDGKEEKHYDGIVKGGLSFSPDSKHMVYGARAGDKSFVVIDGKEENELA